LPAAAATSAATDAVAVGAATAFMEYLLHHGKKAVIFCTTPVGEKWKFLHHADQITSDPSVFKDPEVDTIVMLDSGDLRYAGVDQLVKDHKALLINIDHHATNELYGHINMVDPSASSTTEILYRLFKHTNTPFNQHSATSLLTGFYYDTDSFTNAATSADAMAVASDLVRSGGNIHAVQNNAIKNRSLASLKLLGTVLSRLQKYEPLGLTYTYITKQDIENNNITESDSEGIANLLNNLGDTRMALILKETTDGKVKASFRTIHHDVDVAEIAKKFGGGGHKKAAGFTTSGTIEEVLQKILTTA
jgi:phosphoesterase RecJ-like protein